MNEVVIQTFSKLSKLLFLPLLFFINSCTEPCDGDSFYEWLTIDFVILDRETQKNFFPTSNPNYNYSDFKVTESSGEVYENNTIQIFHDGLNDTQSTFESALTKYYYFDYNDYDQDTLKIIVKGTFSDPCGYEIAEYIKVYYNNQVVYYDLFPPHGYETDTVKIYKEI